MRRIGMLLISAIALTHVLPAQKPADRLALTALKDSLTSWRDMQGLLAVENQTIEIAKSHRNDALIHLRLGLIANRIAQLGEKKHADYAIAEFEWALELQPDWPWAQYGIGLGEQTSHDRAEGYAGGLFTFLGLDGKTKAAKAFEGSMAADSNFVEAIVGLSNIAIEQRLDPPVAAALPALRHAAAMSNSPDLFLLLGDLERRHGSPDSALAAFMHARNAGAHAARVSVELARTVPLVADSVRATWQAPRCDSAYFDGAASDDSDVVSLYRADMRPILDDSTLATFDALHGAARVAWLRDFWGKRDQLELREPGTRLAEHFRRWAFVRTNYTLPPFRRRYSEAIDAYVSNNREIDDRGVVYLRHGAPVNRRAWQSNLAAQPPVPPGMTNSAILPNNQKPYAFYRPPMNSQGYGSESWLYQQPDGDVVLHFAAHYDPDDYVLQNTVYSLPDEFADYMIHGSKIHGQLSYSKDGNYSRVAEDKIRGKRDNATAVATDSWTRVYEHILPGKASWLSAGRRDGIPLVHLVYAADAKVLSAQLRRLIPLTFRAAFLDATGKVVGTIDTVQMVERPAAKSRAVATMLELPLPTGAIRARLSVEVTPDLGSLMRTDTLQVPTVNGTTLDMSDILIGRAGHSLQWNATPDQAAWLDPKGADYASADTVHIFAEAYGVKAGAPYRVSIALTKKSGGMAKLLGRNDPAINVTESLTFSDAVGRFSRDLPLAALGAGTYLLEVTVVGPNGTATRSRDLVIRKP